MKGIDAGFGEAIPPLQRVQFPWRLAHRGDGAGGRAAGSTDGWRHHGLGRGGRRVDRGDVGPVVALHAARLAGVRVPQDFEELARLYFARTPATNGAPRRLRRHAAGVPFRAGHRARAVGRARPSGRRAGCAAACGRRGRPTWFCHTTNFPVGWHATLDGRPVPLAGGPYGLMRADLPPGADGVLEVAFGQTPMRSLGWSSRPWPWRPDSVRWG